MMAIREDRKIPRRVTRRCYREKQRVHPVNSRRGRIQITYTLHDRIPTHRFVPFERTCLMPSSDVFRGCMPALMTPCFPDRTVNYEALVNTARELIDTGMRAVVYCGSMGDWPLLTDRQRQEGVQRLVEAGVPVVVGT